MSQFTISAGNAVIGQALPIFPSIQLYGDGLSTDFELEMESALKAVIPFASDFSNFVVKFTANGFVTFGGGSCTLLSVERVSSTRYILHFDLPPVNQAQAFAGSYSGGNITASAFNS